MSTRRRQEQLVRYVSPFGSPAWMTRERAQRHLAEDDARWCWLVKLEAHSGETLRSERERKIGPPRIEHAR